MGVLAAHATATPLRVVFLTHSYPRFVGDAAGSFLLTLAQALQDQGVHVEVVAPSAAGLPLSEMLGGIAVHRFHYAPRSWETLAYTGTMAESVAGSLRGKLAMLGYLMGQGSALRRIVRQTGADLVHAHWWFPAGLAATRPYIVTMHGSDVRLATQKTWAHPLFRGVLQRAAAATTVSQWLADRAREIAPLARPVVAPMPVNTSLFQPSPRARSTDEVLFVGRLNEQKGLHVLLDALAMMRRRARLQVVGEGPHESTLKRQATELGVLDRITWHGSLKREALLALYQRAAVVAIPSRDEGLGLVAVEAQLCETPVVAFSSGGLPDVIADGQTGLLTPVGDTGAMAAAIDRLLADVSLARSLGAAGRRAAQAEFSPNAVAARYAELYRGVLSAAA